jgi:hypothetical protein
MKRGFPAIACALLIAGATMLAGCTDRLAGGTIETTNGIAARVVLPSGNAASNIKVFLIDEQDWLVKTKSGETIIAYTAETDTGGNFEFRVLKVDSTRAFSLYADVEGYGLLIHGVTQKILTEIYDSTIGMSKKVSYQGTIKDTTFETEKIYLAGTPFAADVDTAGNFVIKNVPPESYAVVIQRKLPDNTKEYVVGEKVRLDEYTEGKPAIIVPDTTKAFLIDDFEDKDHYNLLRRVFAGGGEWDLTDDRIFGGISTMSQPANNSDANWSSAIKDGDNGGPRIHALQVKYVLGGKPRDTTEHDPFVMLEGNLGNRGVHYDFSGMDSLTFHSGGNGSVTVELVQQNPAGSFISMRVIAAKTYSLDSSAWTRFTLKPSDLAVSVPYFPENPQSLKKNFEDAGLPAYTSAPGTWDEMGGKITQIRFKIMGGNEFWLDDIRVHGITEGALVK